MAKHPCQIITIANQKGGVAKTTTAVNLAHGLARKGAEVLIIDLDPQAQCSTLLGIGQEPGILNLLVARRPHKELVRFTGRERLWLIPGSKDTAVVQVVLSAQRAPISTLRDVLSPLTKNGLSYIIIDTAPSVGDIQAMAIWASNHVLIPTACDYASTEGVIKLYETMANLKKDFSWPGGLLGILPTFYDSQTNETRSTIDYLGRHFKDTLLEPIHRATILRECMAVGQTIYDLDPESRAGKEYTDVVDRIWRVTQ
jgi:chromosome partitioning protein